jgi:hypothetical protein
LILAISTGLPPKSGCIRRATPLKSGRGEWPANPFETVTRELAGAKSSARQQGSLVAYKSQLRDDIETAAKDGADVAALSGATHGEISTRH